MVKICLVRKQSSLHGMFPSYSITTPSLFRSKDPRRLFRGTSKVSKILRAPAKELEWDSDQVIDAVVKVMYRSP